MVKRKAAMGERTVKELKGDELRKVKEVEEKKRVTVGAGKESVEDDDYQDYMRLIGTIRLIK